MQIVLVNVMEHGFNIIVLLFAMALFSHIANIITHLGQP